MKRYIVVCEGRSEYVYLERLQSFLDSQATAFDVPLHFHPCKRNNADGSECGGGFYKSVVTCYRQQYRNNRRTPIEIWVDHDLYLRNDYHNRDLYLNRPAGIPTFRFSYHNFEDFIVMHKDEETVRKWHSLFAPTGHYTTPLHAIDYLPCLESVLPGYKKGDLSPDFISREALQFLKRNAVSPKIPPSGDANFGSFAVFLLGEIEAAFPGLL